MLKVSSAHAEKSLGGECWRRWDVVTLRQSDEVRAWDNATRTAMLSNHVPDHVACSRDFNHSVYLVFLNKIGVLDIEEDYRQTRPLSQHGRAEGGVKWPKASHPQESSLTFTHTCATLRHLSRSGVHLHSLLDIPPPLSHYGAGAAPVSTIISGRVPCRASSDNRATTGTPCLTPAVRRLRDG